MGRTVVEGVGFRTGTWHPLVLYISELPVTIWEWIWNQNIKVHSAGLKNTCSNLKTLIGLH